MKKCDDARENSPLPLRPPWEAILASQAEVMGAELARELSHGHPLQGLALTPVARSTASDEVLFRAEDGGFVDVHLTFSGRAERSPWPICRVFASFEAWADQVMRLSVIISSDVVERPHGTLRYHDPMLALIRARAFAKER